MKTFFQALSMSAPALAAVLAGSLASALPAQSERVQLRIAVDAWNCKMKLQVDADSRDDFFCVILAGDQERLQPLFADAPPILGEPELVAAGHGYGGKFVYDADLPSGTLTSVWIQAITADAQGRLEATNVLRLRPYRHPDWPGDDVDADKVDTDAIGIERPPLQRQKKCHPTDADDCKTEDAIGGETERLDPLGGRCTDAGDAADIDDEILRRLDLKVHDTDSIPPWYSLQATFKAPGEGYGLGVMAIDRSRNSADVYLVLSVPEREDDGRADHEPAGELLHAGAELGFGLQQVRVFLAVDGQSEPRKFRLVRCFGLDG